MDEAKAISELKGARVLYKRAGSNRVLEGQVQALSADDKFVKLDNSGEWFPAGEIGVLEVLEEAPKPKAAKPAKPAPAAGETGAPAGN